METLKVSDILEYCEQAADTAQALTDKALASSNVDARNLDAVAWFMQRVDLYRYILPGIIRELAKREPGAEDSVSNCTQPYPGVLHQKD